MFVSPAIHGSYEFGRIAYHQYVNMKEILYEVQSLKSNEDMILALAGQFLSNLSDEPENLYESCGTCQAIHGSYLFDSIGQGCLAFPA